MQQAEKKLKSFSIFGAAGKTEAAMELYDKAAAQFKMTKQWDDAGDAYIKMAECAEKISNQLEAVNAYTNAAKGVQKRQHQGGHQDLSHRCRNAHGK
jgi:alpha-soluble NSF attachment protein